MKNTIVSSDYINNIIFIVLLLIVVLIVCFKSISIHKNISVDIISYNVIYVGHFIINIYYKYLNI